LIDESFLRQASLAFFWITLTDMYARLPMGYYIAASYAWKKHPRRTTYGGTLMKPQKYQKHSIKICIAAMLIAPFGCGDNQAAYQSETLVYENPASSKMVADNQALTDLELSESQQSDFGIAAPFGVYPWGPFPFYDYYLDLIPVPVPIGPGLAVVDFVHPFYAFAAFDPFWSDDDGGPFSDDDHDRSSRDDD
jgi:hypothetical protein